MRYIDIVLAVICFFGFQNAESSDVKGVESPTCCQVAAAELGVGSSSCYCDLISTLQDRVSSLESGLEALSTKLDEVIANRNLVADSVTIGRWVIQAESDVALVIRDTVTGGDKRYAFYNGGFADMYQAGTGGVIEATQIKFPTRWSIQEESGTYLVVRDRGVPSGDYRYAFSATRYTDL